MNKITKNYHCSQPERIHYSTQQDTYVCPSFDEKYTVSGLFSYFPLLFEDILPTVKIHPAILTSLMKGAREYRKARSRVPVICHSYDNMTAESIVFFFWSYLLSQHLAGEPYDLLPNKHLVSELHYIRQTSYARNLMGNDFFYVREDSNIFDNADSFKEQSNGLFHIVHITTEDNSKCDSEKLAKLFMYELDRNFLWHGLHTEIALFYGSVSDARKILGDNRIYIDANCPDIPEGTPVHTTEFEHRHLADDSVAISDAITLVYNKLSELKPPKNVFEGCQLFSAAINKALQLKPMCRQPHVCAEAIDTSPQNPKRTMLLEFLVKLGCPEAFLCDQLSKEADASLWNSKNKELCAETKIILADLGYKYKQLGKGDLRGKWGFQREIANKLAL